MSVGERIKEERVRLALSQEVFGLLGGVAKIAQFNYEKNNRKPDTDYLEKLYQAGVDVVYIITGRKDTFTKDELEMIALFKEASLEQKFAAVQALQDKKVG